MSTQHQQHINKPGSCLYYSCLFLNDEQKQNLSPLLNFSWRTERIPRFSHEPEVVNTQLGWWQKEIALAYNLQATHPLVIELMQSIKNRADKNNSDFTKESAEQLVSSLTYSLKLQQDCQNDNDADYLQHSINKRLGLLTLASALIDADPLQHDSLSTVCELLVGIDIVDGFHRDAAAGIISLPLDFLIKQKVTVDDLTQKDLSNQQFWKHWLQRNLSLYQQLWKIQHPLIEVVIIYSGLRLLALKKSLQKSSSANNNCYNSRPTLSPLQKFWLSWRIRSRWSSGKKPLRNLMP